MFYQAGAIFFLVSEVALLILAESCFEALASDALAFLSFSARDAFCARARTAVAFHPMDITSGAGYIPLGLDSLER